ncbi:hypothetical protein ACIF8Z_01000 [Pseudomonas promysalinigenes]
MATIRHRLIMAIIGSERNEKALQRSGLDSSASVARRDCHFKALAQMNVRSFAQHPPKTETTHNASTLRALEDASPCGHSNAD